MDAQKQKVLDAFNAWIASVNSTNHGEVVDPRMVSEDKFFDYETRLIYWAFEIGYMKGAIAELKDANAKLQDLAQE